MMKFNKEFREAHPETIGETDRAFDMQNYAEWLEQQLVNKNDLLQRVMPRFSEIDRKTDIAFDWLLKKDNHACDAANNSQMIRVLTEKYNELARYLNGA